MSTTLNAAPSPVSSFLAQLLAEVEAAQSAPPATRVTPAGGREASAREPQPAPRRPAFSHD